MKQFRASEMNHAVWMNSIPCYILHKAEFIFMKLPMLTSHIKKSNHLMNHRQLKIRFEQVASNAQLVLFTQPPNKQVCCQFESLQ